MRNYEERDGLFCNFNWNMRVKRIATPPLFLLLLLFSDDRVFGFTKNILVENVLTASSLLLPFKILAFLSVERECNTGGKLSRMWRLSFQFLGSIPFPRSFQVDLLQIEIEIFGLTNPFFPKNSSHHAMTTHF